MSHSGEVDQALLEACEAVESGVNCGQWAVRLLADEVVALRKELAHLQGAYDVLLRGEAYQAACSLLNASVAREVSLRAAIERIEKLPAVFNKYSEASRSSAEYAAAGAWEDAADYVSDALKGGSDASS